MLIMRYPQPQEDVALLRLVHLDYLAAIRKIGAIHATIGDLGQVRESVVGLNSPSQHLATN
jgi:hypothetical protein